ncbi:SDR family NAD(P)-dependent oxidoreductase [Dyadobacter sandarakinus]|uniref:SDR family NAD(P)-dependent oxidoreductase n=1 Tax=Dyadobacter sandarakinus TaxID=2747268 RepID=A0ABX7I361_9BACT|nr:SDR family NAD(P)-dependent oxidoreductase [Dyadobacter sandarakinus]QRR00315.1 SDR family NAD(P)-dependent oxidoreductase [Dyadobacter sandarakinus]
MSTQGNNLIQNHGRTLLATLAAAGVVALARTIYQKMTRVEWEGKTVLITGGSRGLGLELARVLGDQGARIAICARSGDQLQRAEAELQGRNVPVLAISADITNPGDAKKVVETVIAHFGGLDLLINNAGTMLLGPENTMELSDYQRVMDANLWSALHCIQAVLPHFRAQGGGRIANICSIGGKIAVPHMLPYSVSKFAMVGLSEGLAAELKKDHIHVTTVIPNLMRTGSPRNVSVKGDHEGEYAWFKFSDSLPLLSQNAAKAAAEIVEGISNGENEVVLTLTARAAIALNGIAPGSLTTLTQLANRFLPKSDNRSQQSGAESESHATDGPIAALTDEAARRNNEL